jgi:hypothetical protein
MIYDQWQKTNRRKPSQPVPVSVCVVKKRPPRRLPVSRSRTNLGSRSSSCLGGEEKGAKLRGLSRLAKAADDVTNGRFDCGRWARKLGLRLLSAVFRSSFFFFSRPSCVGKGLTSCLRRRSSDAFSAGHSLKPSTAKVASMAINADTCQPTGRRRKAKRNVKELIFY